MFLYLSGKSSAFLEYLTNMWKEANYLFIIDVDEYKCIENEVDRRNKALDIRNKYLKLYACFEVRFRVKLCCTMKNKINYYDFSSFIK